MARWQPNAQERLEAAAFALFAPFRGIPKATIFGSARTRPDDALYRAAVDVAAAWNAGKSYVGGANATGSYRNAATGTGTVTSTAMGTERN